jgi:hypothetical protein
VKSPANNAIRRVLASSILVTAVLLRSAPGAAGQDVRNTSYVTKSGERVLRTETVVPTSPRLYGMPGPFRKSSASGSLRLWQST